MCYNAASLTQASLKYAKHRGESAEDIAAIEQKLEVERKLLNPFFHVNAFAHPPLLCFTNKEPLNPVFYNWGLIPSWTKDEEQAASIANQTLNARSETMFEKPSFRNAADNKRCLIYLDAFYEFHHFKNKTFPFHISMKDHSPMILAGLYDEWLNKHTGELIKTVSIVTCEGNNSMNKIHNNPKNTGPRMPLILHKEDQNKWLKPIESKEDKDSLLQLIKPFSDELLEYYTVGKLIGKDAIGNIPEVEHSLKYDELTDIIK